MLDFVARRLVAIIPVLAVVAIFVFLMLRLTPGDPAAVIAGDYASEAQIAEIREKLGLSKPLVEQFFIWSGRSSPSGSATCCKAISARASSSRRPWPS